MRQFIFFLIIFSLAVFLGCGSLTDPSSNVLDEQRQEFLEPGDDPLAKQAELKAFRALMRERAATYRARLSKRASNPNLAMAQGATITVPDDFSTIQEAVDNAAAGTKIKVKDGTYSERVTVMTDDLRIIAVGDVTVDGGFDIIDASGVQIEHFTITNTNTPARDRGICVSNSPNLVVKDNVIDVHDEGIDIDNSDGCQIRDNEITSADDEAIDMDDSDNCEIKGNTLNAPDNDALELDDCNDAKITGNTMIDPLFDGIDIDNGTGFKISDNLIEDTGNSGMELTEMDDSTINDNIVKNSGDGVNQLDSDGISLPSGSDNNTIKENVVCGSLDQDIDDQGSGNTFKNNTTGACN